jgi:hypothetical protein
MFLDGRADHSARDRVCVDRAGAVCAPENSPVFVHASLSQVRSAFTGESDEPARDGNVAAPLPSWSVSNFDSVTITFRRQTLYPRPALLLFLSAEAADEIEQQGE